MDAEFVGQELDTLEEECRRIKGHKLLLRA